MPMFPRWKLAVQAKMLFELLFQDKQRIIRIANDLIDHCINSEMEDSERKDEILQKQNQISRVKNKLNNLLDMRLADEISKDIYNKKKDELENELALYEKQIEELTNFSPLSQEEIDNRIELLKYAASHQLDFDKYNIPDEIIDAFVEKIVVYKDYFEWYLKFDDDDCIRCLVNGTKRKNDVQIVGDPPLALLQHTLREEESSQKIFDFRDKLEATLAAGDGPENLTLIGGATGLYCGYVDFIAWDIRAVLQKAKEFFEDTDIPWASFHTFCREAGTVTLKNPPEEGADDERTDG